MYQTNVARFFYDQSYTELSHGFLAMVKSNEIHQHVGEIRTDENGHAISDTKPRCICVGGKQTFGIMQALMHDFYKAMKKATPGFIHSMDCHDLKEHICDHITEEHSSLSYDGSMYDSTQDARLQNIVETSFLVQCEPLVRQWLELN